MKDAENKKQRAKKQHILPHSYLKRFATEDQVWVHNFQQKKSYVNNIRDAACIDDFYTVQTVDHEKDDCIESGFLSQIEGIGNPIISAMTDGMIIPTGHDKALFSNYLAITYTRGFWFRQILSEVHEHFANDLAEKLISNKELYENTMENFKKETGVDSVLTFEEAKEIHAKSEISMKMPRTYYVEQMILYAAPLVNLFYGMNLNLLYASPQSKAKFITSDKPIAVITNGPLGKYEKWIEDPEAVLYFPLSSLSCLMIDRKKESMVLPANRKKIASINGLIANECVYASISNKEDFIWLRINGTISGSREELFDLLAKDKETQPRVNDLLGKKLKSKCRNDLNVLRGRDE